MMIISVVVFMRGRLLQRLVAVHTDSTDPTMRLSSFAQNRPRIVSDVSEVCLGGESLTLHRRGASGMAHKQAVYCA